MLVDRDHGRGRQFGRGARRVRLRRRVEFLDIGLTFGHRLLHLGVLALGERGIRFDLRRVLFNAREGHVGPSLVRIFVDRGYGRGRQFGRGAHRIQLRRRVEFLDIGLTFGHRLLHLGVLAFGQSGIGLYLGRVLLIARDLEIGRNFVRGLRDLSHAFCLDLARRFLFFDNLFFGGLRLGRHGIGVVGLHGRLFGCDLFFNNVDAADQANRGDGFGRVVGLVTRQREEEDEHVQQQRRTDECQAPVGAHVAEQEDKDQYQHQQEQAQPGLR